MAAARDRAGYATNEAQSDRITRVIHLDGPLSRDQRQRLMQIANRCPVHRTLTSQIDIVTSVADPEPPRAGESHDTRLSDAAIDNLSATVAP
jgi:MoxR-like ATPase